MTVFLAVLWRFFTVGVYGGKDRHPQPRPRRPRPHLATLDSGRMGGNGEFGPGTQHNEHYQKRRLAWTGADNERK